MDRYVCFRDFMYDLEKRYVPLRMSGESRRLCELFKAKKEVINKRKVFLRHKNGAHLRCRKANKKVVREVRSVEYNYEKKLADNVKFDVKFFYG